MTKPKLSRKEKAQETKKIIFESAYQLLNERPFESITIRDIVKRANVSIGTFYNYYSTKLDVYYATYIFADEFFENVVKPKLLLIPDPREKILTFFDYYAKYSSELTDLTLTRILFNPNNKWFDRHSDIGMLPLLTSILEEGLEKNCLKSDRTVQELAQFLMISVRGQVYHWCTNDGSYDLREAVADHCRLLLQIFD